MPCKYVLHVPVYARVACIEMLVFCSSLLLLLLPAHFSFAIPLESFYPFGVNTTDSNLTSNDDQSSGLIELSAIFPFYGVNHTTMFVSIADSVT